MKCLTILTFISGAGGHGIARSLFEKNPLYRWYDHPKNNNSNKNKFFKLNIAEKHFQKVFANGQRFPHLFDRIEPYLNDINLYYNLVQPEIEKCSNGKRLVYTCHATPKTIRERYPNCLIYQILPKESNYIEYFNRHMETAMFFPLQTNIDKLPNRKEIIMIFDKIIFSSLNIIFEVDINKINKNMKKIIFKIIDVTNICSPLFFP